MCLIAEKDFDAARSSFETMTEAGRSESASQYLRFKLGIRSSDTDMGKTFRSVLVQPSPADVHLSHGSSQCCYGPNSTRSSSPLRLHMGSTTRQGQGPGGEGCQKDY